MLVPTITKSWCIICFADNERVRYTACIALRPTEFSLQGRTMQFSVRLLATACAFALSTVALGSTPPDNWQTATSTAGGFSVDMPGKYVEAPGKNRVRTVELKLADGDDRLCLCTVTITGAFYPTAVLGRDEVAQALEKRELNDTQGATLVGSKDVKVQGLPAHRMEFIKEENGSKSFVDELIILAGNREFDLTVVSGPNVASISNRVFTSFKLADPRFVGPGEWVPIDLPDWGFSLSMPGFPERSHPRGADDVLILQNYGFELFAAKVSGAAAHAKEYIDQKQASLVEVYKGKIDSQRDVPMQGATARRIAMTFNNGASRIDSLILVKNDKLVMMQVVNSRLPGVDSRSVENYLNSINFK
jgi:hypothetical protein